MSRFQRVVWNEGMFLSSHNFQAWEQYLKDEFDIRFKALHPFDWGVIEVVANTEDIAGGSFALTRCKGIMPDGLPFDIPESDRVPEIRPITEHFRHTARKLDVHLGIPVIRADAANCRFDEEHITRDTRYVSDFIHLNDENTGENKREIRIARPNFKILFGDELLDDYTCIKIAELGLNAAGLYEIQEAFIPPCLNISASRRIMMILRSLLDRLSGLSANLAQQLSQKSATQYEFHSQDLNTFGLLSTINSYLPVFSQYYQLAKAHPEQLYLQMAQFAGALTTFSTEITHRDIIPYQHSELGECFGTLEQLIIRLLKDHGPDKCTPISLRRINETLVQGEISIDLFEGAQFFLSATANETESQLQNILPQKLKIGPPDKIEFLIQRALRGVPVAHATRPHPAIPIKVGHDYFKLDISNDLWDEIKKSKQIAIYFPTGISGFKLELFAVKE